MKEGNNDNFINRDLAIPLLDDCTVTEHKSNIVIEVPESINSTFQKSTFYIKKKVGRLSRNNNTDILSKRIDAITAHAALSVYNNCFENLVLNFCLNGIAYRLSKNTI